MARYSSKRCQNWPVHFQIAGFASSLLYNSSPLREMSFTNKSMTWLFHPSGFCVGGFGVHAFSELYKMKEIPGDHAASHLAGHSWQYQGGSACYAAWAVTLFSELIRTQFGAWQSSKNPFGRKYPVFLMYLSVLPPSACANICVVAQGQRGKLPRVKTQQGEVVAGVSARRVRGSRLALFSSGVG